MNAGVRYGDLAELRPDVTTDADFVRFRECRDWSGHGYAEFAGKGKREWHL